MNQRLSILLIDDDEDDRWLFTDALNRTVPSVKCITASGGQEAISLLDEGREKLPDLIFLDLNMPGMDGKKCLSLLKAHDKLSSIPVIVYSTSNFPKDTEDAIRLGAKEFIMKPADYSQLCEMLHSRLSNA